MMTCPTLFMVSSLVSSITSGYERPWEQRQGTLVQKVGVVGNFVAKIFAPDALSFMVG